MYNLNYVKIICYFIQVKLNRMLIKIEHLLQKRNYKRKHFISCDYWLAYLSDIFEKSHSEIEINIMISIISWNLSTKLINIIIFLYLLSVKHKNDEQSHLGYFCCIEIRIRMSIKQQCRKKKVRRLNCYQHHTSTTARYRTTTFSEHKWHFRFTIAHSSLK